MRRFFLQALLLGSIVVFSEGFMTSCASSKHCPAVAGTGNSASRRTGGFGGGGKCPAVKGTGNYKPKVRRKPQDGLTSKKMDRAMAKAQQKKSSPIQSRTLSADQ